MFCISDEATGTTLAYAANMDIAEAIAGALRAQYPEIDIAEVTEPSISLEMAFEDAG